MQLFYFFFYFLFFHMHIIHAAEYVYPIASCDNGAIILYIHQFSPQSIELFEWDTTTNRTEQILWSLFNPAGLQLLPNNRGFSFLDNGRLRIKLFQRRAPKTIEFDEPIFNINGLEWIDDHRCYCSAQHGDSFSLFELYDNGSMYRLVSEDNKDCMYPQKVGDQLLYIERSKSTIFENQYHYRIMHTTYGAAIQSALAIDYDERPIIFLHMLSQTEGFVIEHEKHIENDAHIANFLYHHITKRGHTWQSVVLFSFAIPTNLFLDNNDKKLFESILPLLPRIVENRIYFVDCSSESDNYLEPYYYDLSIMQHTKIIVSSDKKRHFFVPMACGEKLYSGGSYYGDGEKELFTSFLT